MLRLSLLGTPLVQRDGLTVSFDTRKAVALLAYLCLEDHPHSRERLATFFWPGSDELRARSALRRTLSVTAAAVGDVLVVDRAAVQLRADAWESDAREFATLAAADDITSLDQAARIYRDDFLAGFTLRDAPDFDDWLHFTADGLRQQLAGVLEQLVDVGVESGDLPTALGHARRWLSLDPLHEPAHQSLIRLHAWMGQRSAALQQYRACVRVLDQELGVGPLPETRRLADEVRVDQLAPPAQSRAAASAEHRPGPALDPPAVVYDEPPLVGRETALAAIEVALSGTAGTGRALHVTGPVGIGKTRVLTELARAAQQGGGRVVMARCHERERVLAYGLIVELLRVATHTQPDLADRLGAHTRAEIARLVPELADPGAPVAGPLDGPGAVVRLYAAIGDALVTAAGASAPGGPATIIIDDAHFADEPSAELLAYLVRRMPDIPLLIAVGHLDDSSDESPLVAALTEADGAGAGQVVALQSLDRDEVGAVLRSAGVQTTDERIDELHRETGGLPFLVAGYARALRSAADSHSAPPTIPADVRAGLLARLAGVAEMTQQVLAAAAILGSRVDLDLLRATSGRGETETVDAVEDGVRTGLLAETESAANGAPTYDFPYAALRQVVDDRIGSGRRRLLHSRAADALLRRPAPVAAGTVARHLHEGGRLGEAAHWYWQAAVEARALFAHVEALGHVEQARSLGHPAAAAHFVAGELLTTLGRYPEALAAYEAAAATFVVGDAADPEVTRLAAVEHRLADVHHRLGDYGVAEAHARAALDLLQTVAAADRALVARVVADQALIAYRRGDDARAQGTAERALDLAAGIDDAAAAAQALDVLGMVALRRNDLAAAERFLEDSLARARPLPDPSSAVAALNNLSRLYAQRSDLTAAVAAAREALAIGNSHGDRHRAAALHTNLADLLHATNHGDEAMTHLKRAATLFAGIDEEGDRRPEIWKLVQW